MIRQGHLMAVVVSFLMGCAVLLVADGSGAQAEATGKQGNADRCEGTRFITWMGSRYTTNDLPGCPSGGLLSGTDTGEGLRGEQGDDEVRGLGGSDELYGGDGNDALYGEAGNDFLEGEQDDDVIYGGDDGEILVLGGRGDDVIYGGDGKDYLAGNQGDDVIHGGDGNEVGQGPPWDPTGPTIDGGPGEDVIYGGDGKDYLDGMDCPPVQQHPNCSGKVEQRDALYCGGGWDRYVADKLDYVSSSCEKKELPSPRPFADTGGAPLILPAGALLLGTGLLLGRSVIRRAT